MESKIIQIDFGNRLRTLRTKRGISQEKLAELSNLHRTYLGDIERGERNVSLINIVRIAEGLNIDVAELFNGWQEKLVNNDMEGENNDFTERKIQIPRNGQNPHLH